MPETILVVDDDPDIARLVQHILSSHGFGPAIQVTTGREALASPDRLVVNVMGDGAIGMTGMAINPIDRRRATFRPSTLPNVAEAQRLLRCRLPDSEQPMK